MICAPRVPGILDRLVLGIGLGTFGEIFPLSSQKSPAASNGQLSLLGGARFWIGTQLPKRVRVMLVIDAGVADTGANPLKGSKAILEGAGGEVALELFDLVKPFVRFTYQALVFSLNTNLDQGALAYSAAYVSVGARIRYLDLHLNLGGDYSGGVSVGLGLGLQWMY